MADKIMEPRNADPGFPAVFILVIIADLVKIITIVKYADSYQLVDLIVHDSPQ
jgi:hypothetical protein